MLPAANNSGGETTATQKTCTFNKPISRNYPNYELPEVKTDGRDRRGLRSSRLGDSGSRWWSRRRLTSPPHRTHWRHSCGWSSFLWEKPGKQRSGSYMSGKPEKPTPTPVRPRHHLTVNPVPSAAACNWEGTHDSELLPEKERTCTPYLAPQLFRPHLKDRTPKCLALKVNGACIHKTYKAIENWERFFFLIDV